MNENTRSVLWVVAAVLYNAQGQILLTQRPQNKPLGGLWELPGGKIEPSEHPQEALARELKEELNLLITRQSLEPFTFVCYPYEEFDLVMLVYLCHRFLGAPVPQEGQEMHWVSPEELSSYAMPPADKPVIERLRYQRGWPPKAKARDAGGLSC